MTEHLKMSRVAKALTDRANGAASFTAAEKRLSGVRLAVVLQGMHAATPAGQAAALTAVNASFKCFGKVTLVAQGNTPLVRPLPIGADIGSSASHLGGFVVSQVPPDATHVIFIGDEPVEGIFVRCWWDGWVAGIVPSWDHRAVGASANPLAGVFSGALAVREVFATVLGYPRCGSRVSITSLWEPGRDPLTIGVGPRTVFVPPRLWFIGVGHLGQGILWSLGLLPVPGLEVVMQDDQNAGEENEATGLLTRGHFYGRRKVRIAADWLDRAGWSTRLMERRHYGDIPLLENDPSIVVTSLDEPDARIKIASAAIFEYMIDAGIGHGPVDFEGLQVRVLERGSDPLKFWSSPQRPKDVDKLLQQPAYRGEESVSDECGTFDLANASVAVPFVGAAVGALTVATLMRLASMQVTPRMLQMELGAPAMAIWGGENSAPTQSRGSIEVHFE